MVGLGDSDYNDYVYDGLVGYNVRSLIALEQNPKPIGLSELRHYYNNNFRILTSPDANKERGNGSKYKALIQTGLCLLRFKPVQI